MNLKKHSRTFALAALGLFAGTASAHTGDHAVTGFASGLAHPLLGLDHLFAMIAIGLWAAQQGGRALWAVPAAFAGAMVVGGGCWPGRASRCRRSKPPSPCRCWCWASWSPPGASGR
jgi:urease accessory protein